jgi:O-antigen/teichoic acid export membrane protein
MIKTAIKSERFKRLSKEGFWIILGKVAVVTGVMVGVRIITTFLDPVSYGQLALGMTAATLVNQFIMGPLSNGITRFYAPALEKNDLLGYFSAVRKMVFLAISIIVFIMLIMIAGFSISKSAAWIPLIMFAFLFAIANGCNAVLNGMQNAARQRQIVSLHQGAEAWLRFLSAAGVMLLLGATSTSAMAGFAVASILIILSQSVFFKRITKGVTQKVSETNWTGQIWKFSWPFSVWGIFTWAQMASSRWGLEFFSNTYEVGLYAVLFQLGYYPISTITDLSMQFFAPIFYQRAGDATDNTRNLRVHRLSWRLTFLFLLITAAGFAAAFFLHPLIFRVFTAREYHAVSYLLPWILLAGGIFAAGQTIALNLMSRMKTYDMMAAKIGTAVLGVIFNFAGAYFYGTKGVVAAGIMFSIMYSVWMAMLSNRYKAVQGVTTQIS